MTKRLVCVLVCAAVFLTYVAEADVRSRDKRQQIDQDVEETEFQNEDDFLEREERSAIFDR
jgi:hypothetical protein